MVTTGRNPMMKPIRIEGGVQTALAGGQRATRQPHCIGRDQWNRQSVTEPDTPHGRPRTSRSANRYADTPDLNRVELKCLQGQDRQGKKYSLERGEKVAGVKTQAELASPSASHSPVTAAKD